MPRLDRRLVLQGMAASASTLALSRYGFAQSAQPIRIGVLASLTGFAPSLGRDVQNGAQIAADQLNKAGGIMGRPVQVVVRDDKTNPNEAVAAVNELAGQGINLFVGGVLTPLVLAVFGVLPTLKSTLITTGAIGDSITQQAFTRYGFRLTESASIRGRVIGRFAAQRYPNITRWASFTTDNDAGDSQFRAFESGAKEFYPKLAKKQVEILEPMRVKLGSTDFKNEITRLMASPAQGLMIAHPDPVTLAQQARPFGWERKIMAFLDQGNDVALANAFGKRTPPNFWTASHWHYAAYTKNPASQALYNDYVAKTKDTKPGGFMGITHAAVNAYAQAIKAAGSTETEAVIKALETITIDTVAGKKKFRPEDHQAIGDFNMYHFVPSEKDPAGWEVKEFVAMPDADAALPPTPGQPVKYPG